MAATVLRAPSRRTVADPVPAGRARTPRRRGRRGSRVARRRCAIALPNVTRFEARRASAANAESGDLMASFAGLGGQRTADAAGCAEEEESQADLAS
jgi:hypothetical protein